MKRKIEYVVTTNPNDAKAVRVNGEIYPIVCIGPLLLVFRTGYDRETTISTFDANVLGIEFLEPAIVPKLEITGRIEAFDANRLIIGVEKPYLYESHLRLGDELKLTVEILCQLPTG